MQIHSISHDNIVDEILELGHLSQSQESPEKILALLTQKIASIMQTDVCSLYLTDANRDLVLVATHGLNQSAVGKVRMKVGEGLVGKTLEWLKPISLARGRKSRQFKFFPETGEEKFHSFLSIPLLYKKRSVGVLVVQNEKSTRFSSRSVRLLMTLSIPAIQLIGKERFAGTLDRSSASRTEDKASLVTMTITDQRRQGHLVKGIAASPGIAIARVKILKENLPVALIKSGLDEAVTPEREKEKIVNAFKDVEEEIRQTQKKAEAKFGMDELAIFEAYQMVLGSDLFKEKVFKEINSGHSALRSLEMVIRRYTDELQSADDEYIRERSYDIQDMGRKLSDRLLYGDGALKVSPAIAEPTILFSEFWSISDFVDIDLENTKGILSTSGGASSHIAILAESMSLPAVFGLSLSSEALHDNDLVIMDGMAGVIIINPDENTLENYKKEIAELNVSQAKYQEFVSKKVHPINGERIVIGANMGMMAHVKAAIDSGAEDIGLYRTEFPYLIRKSLPTEEEQFLLYKKVLHEMKDHSVTIRTLDIGGDKYLPYLNLPQEANPFLGWRSIRISLERGDLFRIQLRAILRASAHGKMRLLFPMISSMEEIKKVKEIVREVRKELLAQKEAVAKQIPFGIMIEVPSAVHMADLFIKEVDFFSVGTNDLVQYTLAVDRNNPKVANLYNPLHPSVLRSLHHLVAVTRRAKKPLSVCGEMASQPFGVALLIGMGVTHLSMSAPLIPKIKAFVSSLDQKKTKKMAEACLKSESTTEVQELVVKSLRKQGLGEFFLGTTFSA